MSTSSRWLTLLSLLLLLLLSTTPSHAQQLTPNQCIVRKCYQAAALAVNASPCGPGTDMADHSQCSTYQCSCYKPWWDAVVECARREKCWTGAAAEGEAWALAKAKDFCEHQKEHFPPESYGKTHQCWLPWEPLPNPGDGPVGDQNCFADCAFDAPFGASAPCSETTAWDPFLGEPLSCANVECTCSASARAAIRGCVVNKNNCGAESAQAAIKEADKWAANRCREAKVQ
ncbi:hypothetical protein HDU96_006827, partial [Phlyctochytrium bullatum]